MKAPRPLEKHIQRDVLRYLATRGIFAAHVPNGSVLAGDATARAIQSKSLKLNGMVPGFPDIVAIASNGRVGFIEIKREGEKLGEQQVICREKLFLMGHNYAVVRSIDDAAETLEKWGWA